MPVLDAPLPELAAAAAWAPALAQAFVGLACDIALVLSPRGVIDHVAFGAAVGLAAAVQGWIGRPWAETVTADSRAKIEALLADVASRGSASRREVTLAAVQPAGPRIPVAFAALRLGADGPTLAVGHDLRAVARLQQRFLLAQRDLEQGYQQALDTLTARAMAQVLPAAVQLLGLDAAAPAAPPRRNVLRRPGPARSARRRVLRRR
jgi:hypothetical protein